MTSSSRISVIGARNFAALCLNIRFSCCGAADGSLLESPHLRGSALDHFRNWLDPDI
jgi:hypothetical protein